MAAADAYLMAVTSVIIPAHNEAEVIGRLLEQLLPVTGHAEFDVIVVANGCTDDTAGLAASFGPAVKVVSIPVASKHEALVAGDRATGNFPRIYVDADVELQGGDIRALSEVLQQPGVLAAAPQRKVALAGRSWVVRWYYDVWTRLPEVQNGLFGRGVIGVSESGHTRIAELPPLLADDLAASLVFAPSETAIVSGASVVIHPPRTFTDLLRRRIRAVTTVSQIEKADVAQGNSARTRPSHLIAIVRSNPFMAPRVAAFVALALLARLRARKALRNRDYSTWLRDESSRRK